MKNKVNAKILRKAAKRLHRKLKVEKPNIEVDSLRIIEKRDLVNYKIVKDNAGVYKQIRIKPTLLL